jgi:ubiquinone/menaquinone biosynthesis C-methylase UbiE
VSETGRARSAAISLGAVSRFSEVLIKRSGYELDGFAAVYDAYRPKPPPDLLRLLMLVAQVERPRLVVDLGSGTGLSTRVWGERADRVVGVEANRSMLVTARKAVGETNVEYVEAFADETGLPSGHADIVTCAQSFHWMDPTSVLPEAARLLRRGGVFAAYDYDVPPVLQPEIDDAFGALFEARGEARRKLGLEAGAMTWPKGRHLESIRESGHFRYARELVCVGWEEADAERLIGLAESIGGPRAIFGDAAPEVAEAFERLRRVAADVLGDNPRPLALCYRIRLGVV